VKLKTAHSGIRAASLLNYSTFLRNVASGSPINKVSTPSVSSSAGSSSKSFGALYILYALTEVGALLAGPTPHTARCPDGLPPPTITVLLSVLKNS
jgi:hypothetical protein